ncbi:MAG: hypothetical protein JWP61_2252 [Friedmanniella sp.]|nr:hypothetical protein [Friedmanniella sp.]
MLTFPNPVNEKAARVVAGGVVLLTLLTLATGWSWLLLLLVAGFAARVLAGPRFSVLGQLATRVVAPRLGEPRLVPGPPKRFAQAIGLALTTLAALATWVFVAPLLTTALLVVLGVFATLESVVGFCAGCWIFGLLMRVGVIPADTCEACADVWSRHGSRPEAYETPAERHPSLALALKNDR